MIENEGVVNWFRLYHDMIDDPKVVKLPSTLCWRYVQLLCVASRQRVRGNLPSYEDLAIHLRVRTSEAKQIVKKLTSHGLIDEDETTKALTIHGWGARQRQSDDANDRQRRRRETACHVTNPLQETTLSRDSHVTRTRATDTDTDTEKKASKLALHAPAREPAASLIPIPVPAPVQAPVPPTADQPLDEAFTGRSGQDHADLLTAIQILEGHASTSRLGRELRTCCDTPGVRMIPGWQLIVGSLTTQRPDKGKSWGGLMAFARNATLTEFDRLKVAAEPRPTPAPVKTSAELRAATDEGNRKVAEYLAKQRGNL